MLTDTSLLFDDLVDRFKIENDLKKRDIIIRDALLHINRELPIVTLHKPITTRACSKASPPARSISM